MEKHHVYCCGVGYLGDITCGCHGGAQGFIYCPENTTTAVTNRFDSICWTEHFPVYMSRTTVWDESTELWSGWLARKAFAPRRHHFSACSLCSPLLSHCFTAEFLFLLWAVYLCYAVRTVPSAFHEPRYMAIAVHNELVLSAIFYVIR